MCLRKYGTKCPKDDAAKLLRRGVVLLAALLLVCTLMVGAVSATDDWNNYINSTWYSSHSGEDVTNYYIYDNASFAAFAKNVTEDGINFQGKTVKLMADIDLNTHNWTAIGTETHQFTGIFDGDNHTISNVKVYAPDTHHQGLFGYSATPAVLKNIKIKDIEVIGNASVGSLAGCPFTGSLIENCHVSGTIKITGGHFVGGLVGYTYVSAIKNCSVSGNSESFVTCIYKDDDSDGTAAGGLVGYTGEGKVSISDSSASIDVSGIRAVGGLAGRLQTPGNEISNCIASGSVSLIYDQRAANQKLTAGALVGEIMVSSSGDQTKVSNSKASGSISIDSSMPNTATVSIGLIGATRSGGNYNKPDDLTTLGENVEDTTYEIPAEDLQDLVATGYMETAGIGTVTVDEDTSNPITLLNPGTNVSGVTWTGDDEKGYTLTISGSGSYLLTQSFTTSEIKITGSDIKLDGNNQQITAVSKSTNGAIIEVSGENAELTKMNVVTANNAVYSTSQGGMIVKLSEKNSKLTNSIIDARTAKISQDSRSSFHTVIVSGEGAEVSGSTITAGMGYQSSSQCIVVQGSNIKISGNTLTPGAASKYKGEGSDAITSGSIGVRLAQDAKDTTTITDNTFICTVDKDDTSMNNGIAIDGVTQGVTVTANDNTFTLSDTRVTREEGKKGDVGGFGNAFYINPGADNIEITLSVKGNKVESGTNFLYLDDDNGERTAGYTVKGTIDGNDYHPITGANIHTKVPAAESSFSFAVTMDGLDVKANNYEKGEDPNPPKPVVPSTSSSDGNMNNAFRVLFETQGGSFISPATGLSYGDRVAEPANPIKDGYTFGGWYKDSACTQSWSFSDSIPGDMTLYAKWTSTSGTAATATQTVQTTAKATTAPAATQAQSGTTATTAAPVATTAAGVQPTLTQAPAPVLGGLLGLLAAGILLRRRE